MCGCWSLLTCVAASRAKAINTQLTTQHKIVPQVEFYMQSNKDRQIRENSNSVSASQPRVFCEGKSDPVPSLGQLNGRRGAEGRAWCVPGYPAGLHEAGGVSPPLPDAQRG